MFELLTRPPRTLALVLLLVRITIESHWMMNWCPNFNCARRRIIHLKIIFHSCYLNFVIFLTTQRDIRMCLDFRVYPLPFYSRQNWHTVCNMCITHKKTAHRVIEVMTRGWTSVVSIQNRTEQNRLFIFRFHFHFRNSFS